MAGHGRALEDAVEGIFEYTGPPQGYGVRHKHAPATMIMTVRFSSDCGPLLFEFWHPHGYAAYAASLAAIFALGVLTEALRLGRFRRKAEAPLLSGEDDGAMGGMLDDLLDEPPRRGGAARACEHAVAIGLGYTLMLLAMTYNAGVIAAVVCGLAVGRTAYEPTAAARQSRRSPDVRFDARG